MAEKFLSRKFLLSVAAFLSAFCMGVGGIMPPEHCAVGMALSAGIYAACEAYTDGKRAESTASTRTTTVSATGKTALDAISANKEGQQ